MQHLPSKRGTAQEQDFYAEAKQILLETVSGEAGAVTWEPVMPGDGFPAPTCA